MDFDEAIQQVQNVRHKGPQCWYSKFAEQREDDVEKLDALLDEVLAGLRTGASVGRVLGLLGFRVSTNSVNRHIRRECECSHV